MTDHISTDLRTLTSHMVCAFLDHNHLPARELSTLISTTYDTLARLGTKVATLPEPEAAVGAVTVRKSLASPDFIISMIDGKPYKTLKKHIGRHGLTPDEYRTLYNLPANYPIVAPAYVAKRSEIAKRLRFGHKRPSVSDAAPTPISAPRKPKIAKPKPH